MAKELSVDPVKTDLIKQMVLSSFISGVYAPRSILNSAFTRNNLKESLRSFSVKVDIYAEEIVKLVEYVKYSYGFPEDTPIKEVFGKINQIFENITKNDDEHPSRYIGGMRQHKMLEAVIISNCKEVINVIERNIVTVEASIRVEKDSDNRLNETSIENFYKVLSDSSGYYDLYIDFDRVNKEQDKIKSSDVFGVENLKLVLKKLRIFKSGVISSINKNFGKNSIFGPLNICDEISILS